MISHRVVAAAVLLLLMMCGLGGCPATDMLTQEDESSESLSSNGSAGTETHEQAAGDAIFSLEDLERSIVSGNATYRETISSEYSTISINSNIDVGDLHEHPDPPPDHDDANNSGDDNDDNGSGDSGDEGGGDDGGDDSDDDPPPDLNLNTYTGQTGCTYYESLEDDEQFYGEIHDNFACEESLDFNNQGVPARIPIPPFIGGRDGDRWQVSARFANETEAFEYTSGTVTYNVTVRVTSAVYSVSTAHVVLEIDCSWIGDSASIVAEGIHVMNTVVTTSGLQYTASTDYEGVFTADDDWIGWGIVKFDCGGMLTD